MAEQAYEGMPADMPQMPQENDDLVVVQALSCRLDEPIGTIVVKSVFDTVFPPKLKGQIDSDTYLTTIEVINWFLELRLYAETEKHSKTYNLSQTWKRLHAKFQVERQRQELLRQYCVDNRLVCPFFRDFTFTQEEFDAVEKRLLEALHLFLDDENRMYIPKGWYWTYPENHGWLWVELRRIKESDSVGTALRQKLPQTMPNLPLPMQPEWGLSMKMTVLHTMKLEKHTEYLIAIETDFGKWAPITTLYALKRYSDFEAFYQQIVGYIRMNGIEDITLPAFPEKGIGLHVTNKAAVAKRIDAFQALLNCLALHPDLVSSPPVFRFFDIHPCPVAWRGLPYVRRCFPSW